MGLALLVSGCVVPAPVEEVDAGPALVHIDENKVDPKYFYPYMFPLPTKPSYKFSVLNAVQQVNVTQPLRYYWYYDYEPGTSKDVAATCSSGVYAHSCLFVPCEKAHQNQTLHSILVVVANVDLPADATNPLAFAPGAAWDSLQWKVEYEGACL
jgi:hypothetical protein